MAKVSTLTTRDKDRSKFIKKTVVFFKGSFVDRCQLEHIIPHNLNHNTTIKANLQITLLILRRLSYTNNITQHDLRLPI